MSASKEPSVGDEWRLEVVRGELFGSLDELCAEAIATNFHALERLRSEWQDGRQRFGRPGEALIRVVAAGRLIGIGGITVDPDYPEAMRMRRFYVARALIKLQTDTSDPCKGPSMATIPRS